MECIVRSCVLCSSQYLYWFDSSSFPDNFYYNTGNRHLSFNGYTLYKDENPEIVALFLGVAPVDRRFSQPICILQRRARWRVYTQILLCLNKNTVKLSFKCRENENQQKMNKHPVNLATNEIRKHEILHKINN